MSEKERPQLIIDYEANTDKLVRLGDVVDQFKEKLSLLRQNLANSLSLIYRI